MFDDKANDGHDCYDNEDDMMMAVVAVDVGVPDEFDHIGLFFGGSFQHDHFSLDRGYFDYGDDNENCDIDDEADTMIYDDIDDDTTTNSLSSFVRGSTCRACLKKRSGMLLGKVTFTFMSTHLSRFELILIHLSSLELCRGSKVECCQEKPLSLSSVLICPQLN